jgi:hypothetical protein
VSASPVWTFHQQRISFLLALEGDAAGGVLLLEGDAVGDILTDALRLEGDAAVIGGSVTKRILETVA